MCVFVLCLFAVANKLRINLPLGHDGSDYINAVIATVIFILVFLLDLQPFIDIFIYFWRLLIYPFIQIQTDGEMPVYKSTDRQLNHQY